MGNASTKEAPPAHPSHRRGHQQNGSSSSRTDTAGQAGPSTSSSHLGQTIERITTSSRSRHASSRHNLENALLGFAVASGRERAERDPNEPYKTKEERKMEKEKKAAEERETERIRSMGEEHVDGGYLVTVGVYTGTEDYSLKVVRQLQIERRLAPFWQGIEDHEASWTDAQLVAAAKKLPLPSADAPAPPSPTKPTNGDDMNRLTLPITSRSRSHSYTSDTSPNVSTGSFSNLSLPTGSSTFGNLTRPRAKTFGIGMSRGNSAQGAVVPIETNIGSNSINGRPVEAVLYEAAIECPICFLYYPPHLNRTRCCDQLICSECFVQIKRADPHVPEAMSPPESPTSSAPPADENGSQLVSEPASCPFCKETEFGIIYAPPAFRRGLVYVNPGHPYSAQHQSPLSYTSVTSSSSSLGPASPMSGGSNGFERRKISYASTAPEVITIDRIRPDWSTKLSHARNQQARRAAAATALHTAAYLMGNLGNGTAASGSSNPFSSRRLLRRGTGSSTGTGTSTPNIQRPGTSSGETEQEQALRNHNARRDRMVDLEEMMLMEAIRLSLAEEEERKKKEEKEEAKKKAKQDKEDKKLAKKSSFRSKGKAPERFANYNDPRGSSASLQTVPSSEAGPSMSPLKKIASSTSSTPIRIPSHHKSPSSSSSSSSFIEAGSMSNRGGSSSNLHHVNTNASADDEDGAGSEPMFNFRSLAETLMDDNKDSSTSGKHIENVPDTAEGESVEIEENMHASVATITGRAEKMTPNVTSVDKGKQVDHGVNA